VIGYLALGSNVGNRRAHLRFALAALRRAGVEPLAISSVWETEPHEGARGRWFLNMAVKVETGRGPRALLALLQAIERRAGRRRRGPPNAPRTLDLDLLLLGDLVLADERLTLPHPRMWRRRFVLEPLVEVGADARNPLTGETVAAERGRLSGGGAVRRVGPLAPARGEPL
jgi:2-amino-4-hydroxy-6-hydroxymethyldihydropteridine diphosphokinase